VAPRLLNRDVMRSTLSASSTRSVRIGGLGERVRDGEERIGEK
jgi:hypothetical protein